MARNSDRLHQLIQKLNPTEKRYISSELKREKLHSYAEAFGYLCKQTECNELEFKIYFKNKDFGKNFSIKKHRLQQKCLQYLVQIHKHQDENLVLQEQVNFLQVLLQKGMYDLLKSEIKRLQKTCAKSHNYILLSTVLQYKVFLNMHFDIKQTTEEIKVNTDKLYQKNIFYAYCIYTEKLITENDPNNVFPQLISEVEKIFTDKDCLETHDRYLTIFYNYYTFLQDEEKNIAILEQRLQLYVLHKKTKTPNYYIVLHNYIQSCLLCGKYAKVKPLLRLLEKTKTGNLDLDHRLFSAFILYSMILHIASKKYKEALAFFAKHKLAYEEAKINFKYEKVFWIEFYLSLNYLYLKEYKNAIKACLLIPRDKQYSAYHCFLADFLQILIYRKSKHDGQLTHQFILQCMKLYKNDDNRFGSILHLMLENNADSLDQVQQLICDLDKHNLPKTLHFKELFS